MHSFASLNQGRLSSVFLSTKDFTYQYPSPPHKHIMKSRFWKFCFFPFQEVFFFLTFLTLLDGTGFSPKLPVGRCWWLPGTHHDRVTTLGAAALRPVTRACWEAGNSLVWWYRWLRGVKLMWRDLLYTVICNHNIYLYYIIIINPKQTQRRPKTAQQPVNARYFGGSSFGGICALYMAMKYPGARFLLKWMQFWCQDEHRKLHLPQMEILRWMGWHSGRVSLLLGWQWTLHGWRGTAW